MAGHTGEGVGVALGVPLGLAVRVLEALAEAVALLEADAVRELEDDAFDEAKAEAVAEAEAEAVRVPPAGEADARCEETAEGDAEEDTVGVQEFAPHCTGAGASPPKRVPAAAALCVAEEALSGTPVTLNRSTQSITS